MVSKIHCIIGGALCVILCGNIFAEGAQNPPLIPLPAKIEMHSGIFYFDKNTGINADATSKDTADFLANGLRRATGYKFEVRVDGKVSKFKDSVLLSIDKSATNFGAEGYSLEVAPKAITIHAAQPAGLFYGAQSLLQLLPPQVYSASQVANIEWKVPCVTIADQPRLAWRGYMLDVSRHFFTKKEIEHTLDVMAMHKMNVFHWHLVDDQGWRIEIKKYPRLTQVGAWRKDIGFGLDHNESTSYGPDGRYGGFYTQADIREVVAYAQARHITIVPEIEMPGHSIAALVAYPELSCTGGPFDIDVNGGIFNGIFCAGNDKAFEFLEDVLTEVMDLFPGQYIHIGGDEVPKDNWHACAKCQARIKQEGLKDENELQSYFIRRISKFVASKGRTLIGWSEIRDGGLPANATLMDWKGGGAEAAESGHDVVMSPKEFCYLCYYQSLDRTPTLRATRPLLTLEKTYAFEPVPSGLSASNVSHIIGAEACQWTVYFGSMSEVQQMDFPRLCALAEAMWSPKASRDYGDFVRRLPVHEQRLAECGVDYWQEYSVKIGEWKPAQLKSTNNVIVWEIPPSSVVSGKYRLSLNYTQGKAGLQIQWAALLENGHELLRDSHEGHTGTKYRDGAKARDWNYFLDLPVAKPGAIYTVEASVNGEGGTDSSGVVFLESKPRSSPD